MTMSSDTQVEECQEVTNLPTIQYHFVPIANIATMEPNSIVGMFKLI